MGKFEMQEKAKYVISCKWRNFSFSFPHRRDDAVF